MSVSGSTANKDPSKTALSQGSNESGGVFLRRLNISCPRLEKTALPVLASLSPPSAPQNPAFVLPQGIARGRHCYHIRTYLPAVGMLRSRAEPQLRNVSHHCFNLNIFYISIRSDTAFFRHFFSPSYSLWALIWEGLWKGKGDSSVRHVIFKLTVSLSF